MQRAAAVVRAQSALGQPGDAIRRATLKKEKHAAASDAVRAKSVVTFDAGQAEGFFFLRSEEHTSELQSR